MIRFIRTETCGEARELEEWSSKFKIKIFEKHNHTLTKTFQVSFESCFSILLIKFFVLLFFFSIQIYSSLYRSSGNLSEKVPPVIEPFSFQDGLAEGMRTRIICGVSRGDSPLRLVWQFDGESLSPSLGANVSSLDQYTSILSIPSLSHLNSGEYTCVASNQASEVRYTASLQVKGNVGPLSRFENQKMFFNCLILREDLVTQEK